MSVPACKIFSLCGIALRYHLAVGLNRHNRGGSMKRLLVLAVLLSVPGACLAQDFSGEIQGFYQRVQNIGFKLFDISGATTTVSGLNTNGGGYCFVYNITPVFGFFQQMGFYAGVEPVPGLRMRTVSESQGIRLTKDKGAIAFYAKGGVGFNYYVFSQPGFSGESVGYGMALDYGGGTEIKMSEGMFLVLEAGYKTAGRPFGFGWDTALQITTGVAFRF
jgi:hypothetical protein